jgi:hypothetical protein
MGEEGRVSSLLSFLLSFMYFIPLVGFSLEVSVVLLTLVEDLSVVLYDLSHPDLQLQSFSLSTTSFESVVVLSVMVVVFVVVLRFGFLKPRFAIIRWFQPSTCLSTVLTDAPATRGCWSFLHK